tara:strand:+ start:528 stop:731 length:204 start_codon:yes stop_codon:yes gene_type:complete
MKEGVKTMIPNAAPCSMQKIICGFELKCKALRTGRSKVSLLAHDIALLSSIDSSEAPRSKHNIPSAS